MTLFYTLSPPQWTPNDLSFCYSRGWSFEHFRTLTDKKKEKKCYIKNSIMIERYCVAVYIWILYRIDFTIVSYIWPSVKRPSSQTNIQTPKSSNNHTICQKNNFKYYLIYIIKIIFNYLFISNTLYQKTCYNIISNKFFSKLSPISKHMIPFASKTNVWPI